MAVSEIIGLATFCITVLGMAFALGRQAYRLQILEKDLNAIAQQERGKFKEIDQQLDKLSEFAIRTNEKVSNLEQAVYGDNTLGRVRKSFTSD